MAAAKRIGVLTSGDVPITEAIHHYQAVEPQGALMRTARVLGICFGD